MSSDNSNVGFDGVGVEEVEVDDVNKTVGTAFSSLSAPLTPSKRHLARHNRSLRLAAEKDLAKVEKQIYVLEESYLRDSMRETGGNVIVGWSWKKYAKEGARKGAAPIDSAQRLFSLSSVSSPAPPTASG